MGLAVSGGGDSLALLLLATAALPGRVEVATVDHGLRPESAGEAGMVARVCGALGVTHATLPVALPSGNLQVRAREARYAALTDWSAERGLSALATAHHADDQAETVLMRLARGSGLAGLAGVRARRVVLSEHPPAEVLLVRPLLEWRRAELAEVAAAAGLVPANDPSNADDRFDRVRMRRALAAIPGLDALAIARSAALLQDAEQVVDDAVASILERCIGAEDDAIWFHWGHPRLIETEAVVAILSGFGVTVPRSAAAQMVEQLRADGHATLGGVKARRDWHRIDARLQTDGWRFECEAPRRDG